MIIFVHIPKTAGTHFKSVLWTVYAAGEIVQDYDYPTLPLSKFNTDPIAWRREANKFITNLSQEVKIIIGHLSATKYFDLIPAADLMTWLRHPLPRLISHYFFLKCSERVPEWHHPVMEAAKDASFAEFVEMPVMQNIMTHLFLRTIRLQDFAFIGIHENYSDDLAYLSAMMGWPASDGPLERINANPHPGYREAVQAIMADRDLIRRIERMNRADVEFYEAAVELRQKRLRAGRRRWWLPVAGRHGAIAG